MIELNGLTKQDVQLCDLIWNCDSADSVDALIQNLPPQHKRRAEVLRQLMIAAALDEYLEVTDAVAELIQNLR